MIRYALLCGMLIWISAVSAQGTEGEYPFLDLTKNTILQGRDSSRLNRFLEKLSRCKAGELERITIVHMGGSHVQAGHWTQALHDSLQQYVGCEGGGMFVFPHQLGGNKGPAGCRLVSPSRWQLCKTSSLAICPETGVGGFTVATTDSAGYVDMVLSKKGPMRQFDRITLFVNEAPYIYTLPSLSPDQYTQQYDIEAKTIRFVLSEPADSIRLQFVATDSLGSPLVLHGFLLEDSRPGITLVTAGLNGASTSSALECTLLQQHLKTLNPDLIILSFGVNDVQSDHFSSQDYAEWYADIVKLIQMAAPECAVLFTTVSDHYRRRKIPNRRTMEANQALTEYALSRDYAVWDLFGVMGGFKSILQWQRARLAGRDRIHLTSRGYRLLGQLMFNALFHSPERRHEP